MNLFVNEYKYTTNIISESMAAWWGKRFRSGYISMGICMVLLLILALLKMQWIYFVLELAPISVLVLFRVKVKNAVKLERERMEVVYKDTIPVIRVEIGEDIHVSSDNRDSRVSFSDVENVVETKNLYVLFLKGSLTVALDKKGFTSGNANECLSYIKEHIAR